jgi:hypothetical protein
MSSRPRQSGGELNRATEVIKRVLELLGIVLPRTAFSGGSIFDDRCPAKAEIPALADLGQRPLVSSMEAPPGEPRNIDCASSGCLFVFSEWQLWMH